MKILSLALIVTLSIFLILISLWIIIIPEEVIEDYLIESIKLQKIQLKTEGIKKGIFFSLCIENIFLKNTNNLTILEIKNLKIQPDYITLLRLNPTLTFTGQIHSGNLSGLYILRQRKITVFGKDIKIEESPLLKSININGNGKLSFDLTSGNAEGEITFTIKDLKLKNIFLPNGYILPMELFEYIEGLIAFNKNSVEIKTLSLRGESIYAKIKGNIIAESLDLNMEVMPEASFNKLSYLMIIEPFKVSPGYYIIPLRIKNPIP
ncbi:MAG: type II secretion system protein GspN [Thermodesulfovibrionales bacterium]|nr:type II secretion system protein GspN [Thermodesulfovibrionales bacterium]